MGTESLILTEEEEEMLSLIDFKNVLLFVVFVPSFRNEERVLYLPAICAER
jgi:hypothetical protein